MAVSTLLFVVGIAIERSGEVAETHIESESEHQESSEEHNEGAEAAEASEKHAVGEAGEHNAETEALEATHSETILGINLESPLLVVAAVGVWIALMIGVWQFGSRALVPIIVVAVFTALFDIREIVVQINRANTGIALLAALITLLHLGVAALACWAMSSKPNPETDLTSSAA